MSYDYLEWGGGVYDHLTRLARLCTDNICSSRCARYARFQSSKGTHAALHAGGVVGAGVNGVERRLAVWKMGCSLSAAVAAFHLQWRTVCYLRQTQSFFVYTLHYKTSPTVHTCRKETAPAKYLRVFEYHKRIVCLRICLQPQACVLSLPLPAIVHRTRASLFATKKSMNLLLPGHA